MSERTDDEGRMLYKLDEILQCLERIEALLEHPRSGNGGHRANENRTPLAAKHQ